MSLDPVRILIFAKAPIPGQVKTRLIPALGADRAAALHAELLAGLVGRLGAAPPAPLELWCAPDTRHELFRALAVRWPLALYRQGDGDLGARLLAAARDAGRRARYRILIGADCPLLDRGYLEAAVAALLGGRDAVLGPAEDGGYVLLGLREASERLFRAMPWGTDRVAAITRRRMQGLSWDWLELPMLWDLDRPEDLPRWVALQAGRNGALWEED